MPKQSICKALFATTALALAPAPALADSPTTHATVENAAASQDWDRMLDSLKGLPNRILARLPAEYSQDPLIVREVEQLALGALTSSGIAVLGADVDHPMFLPLSGLIFGIGQPNADTIYRTAQIDPQGVYRIRGTRGSTRIAIVAQHGAVPGDPLGTGSKVPGPAKGQLDLNKLVTDDRGRFDVIVSAQRPEGYMGEWWQLDPGTAKLMVRLVSSDWANEREPTLSIERLDRPVRRSRPDAESLADKLHRLPRMANFIAPLLVADPSQLRSEGTINRLKVHANNRGFLTGQSYYKGAYELSEDEALLIETRMPEQCRYWSVILTNHIYVTTDWVNNQSSLNDSQASQDEDGVLRIVVSQRDPGVPNWLDTAGYPEGLIQGRWFGCTETPIPTIRKLGINDVRTALPPETRSVSPPEREEALRNRRAAAMQRSYW